MGTWSFRPKFDFSPLTSAPNLRLTRVAIQRQGDTRLDKVVKAAWGNRRVHNWYGWTFATEHCGQLVVYDRANNMIPAGFTALANALKSISS